MMTDSPHTSYPIHSSSGEQQLEHNIRPRRLSDYLGQSNVCLQMNVFIRAALARGEALDHVLIHGPPGLGKTTLAAIIAEEMGVGLRHTSGPILEKAGDLVALLTHLTPRDVLFIDEIHRLSPAIEEVLYPAMEDFQVDIIIGEGPAAKSIRLALAPFTLIGATTRAGLLTSPLRDRFGITQHLEFYAPSDLKKIIQRTAHLLNVDIEEAAAHQVACRARGTPRIANRLLRRVRDFAQINADGRITEQLTHTALHILNIDTQGFDCLDRKFLHTLLETFQGGPVGIDSLAAALNEERHTLEEVIEPYLIQEGFVARTGRGRIATKRAYLHFKLPTPPQFNIAT